MATGSVVGKTNTSSFGSANFVRNVNVDITTTGAHFLYFGINNNTAPSSNWNFVIIRNLSVIATMQGVGAGSNACYCSVGIGPDSSLSSSNNPYNFFIVF